MTRNKLHEFLKAVAPLPLATIRKRFEASGEEELEFWASRFRKFAPNSSMHPCDQAVHDDSDACALSLIEQLVRIDDPAEQIECVVDCLFRLSLLDATFSLDRRLDICRYALGAARCYNYPKGAAGALCNIGANLTESGSCVDAVPCFDEAMNVSLGTKERFWMSQITSGRKTTRTKQRFFGSDLICGECRALVATEDHGIPRTFCPHCEAPLLVVCGRCEQNGILIDDLRFVECENCGGTGAKLAEKTVERIRASAS